MVEATDEQFVFVVIKLEQIFEMFVEKEHKAKVITESCTIIKCIF